MEQTTKELQAIRKWVTIGVSFLLLIVVLSGIELFMMLSIWQPYRRIIEMQAEQWDAHHFMERASKLLASNDYEEVIRLSEARKTSYPSDPHVHYYLGEAYLGMNNYQAAIVHLEKAETILPGWKDAWTGPLIKKARQALNAE